MINIKTPAVVRTIAVATPILTVQLLIGILIGIIGGSSCTMIKCTCSANLYHIDTNNELVFIMYIYQKKIIYWGEGVYQNPSISTFHNFMPQISTFQNL